ncbi:MAG: hypothetical protein GF411_13575 [Candidatus Lokiarchaeota archaeon]|nr:hypothetical protein [Candidatus Lokiarchaeota archaeon]
MVVTVFLTACAQVGLSTPRAAPSPTLVLTPTKITPTTTPASSPTFTPTPEPTLLPSPTATRRIDIRNEIAVEYLTSVLIGQPGQMVTHTLVITNLSSSPKRDDGLWARLNPTREMVLDGWRWNYDVRINEYSNSEYRILNLGPQEYKEVSIPVVIPDYATNGMMSELTVKIPYYHQSPSELEPQFTSVVSTPTSIKQLGHIDIPAYGVAIQDKFAYIAAGTKGLHVYDISEPMNPIQVEVYNQQGAVWDVNVKGQSLYVIFGSCDTSDGKWCSQSNLYILDLSYPNQPEEIGFYALSEKGYDRYHQSQKLEILDDYAYIKEAWGQLHILDISNRYKPKNVNPQDMQILDFYLTDKYLYLVPSNPDDPEHNDVKILDRFSLTEIGSYTLTHHPHAKPAKIELMLINSLAYVRTEIPWLGVGTEPISNWIVLDISDPTTPVEITNIPYKPMIAKDIAFVDDYAYLADGKAGLRVLDVSNSVAPVEVDAFGAGAPRYASSVEVSNGYIYLANGEGGLSILQHTYP